MQEVLDMPHQKMKQWFPSDKQAINTTGPWNREVNGITMRISAHSIIDTFSNLLELKRASQNNLMGQELAQVPEDTWLSCHPEPVQIIHHQGSECSNINFESFLVSQGIDGCPCAVKNFQSNAISERVHDVVETLLRTERCTNPPANAQDVNVIINWVLASAQHAVQVCIHKTRGLSLGSITFQRDMPSSIPMVVNLQHLQEKRQAVVDNKNTLSENRHQKDHNHNMFGMPPCFLGNSSFTNAFGHED